MRGRKMEKSENIFNEMMILWDFSQMKIEIISNGV
jgi:hypothetical protein